MNPRLNLLWPHPLTSSTPINKLIGILLKNRSVTSVSDFLQPPPPQTDLKLKKAVSIINHAISSKQQILIYGDYDVDGITATAILWQSLYPLSQNVTPYIPHRLRDGYGISAKSFFRLQKEKKLKFDLIITVDNGIVADKEFAKIKARQQIKIVVTDHHLPGKILPKVSAIVHSPHLSGAGISWFLSRQFDSKADLGLAALGTVADCLPLTGVNRSIVVYGLTSLRVNPSPGIKKLVDISGLKLSSLSAYDLGFVLGPRINAVGRLSDPATALRLLCSRNLIQAGQYAKSLDDYNHRRQQLQKESLDISDKLIDTTNKLLFVVANINPGIIGLVAGRLCEKYYLPVVVITTEGDTAKGSCRSIPELNIIKTLRKFPKYFIDLGGHPAAAGFSILPENIPKLKKRIIAFANQHLSSVHLSPHLDIDAQIDPQLVTAQNIIAVNKLAPYGIGNPEPLFLIKNLPVNSVDLIGQNRDHLKLRLGNLNAIAFRKGEYYSQLKPGDYLNIIAHLSLNTWNNVTSPQLIVKEIIKA